MKSLPRRQRGAVALTVVLLLLFLLGFMGIALDMGKAFTVQSELQTAMDSCALSAANELDFATDATDRAGRAGMTAGNLNRVHLQSVDWGGDDKIASTITYLDINYNPTTAPTQAVYARCEYTQGQVKPWVLGALGMFTGNSAFGNDLSVRAVAVAKRGSTQTTCPVPLALRPPLTPQTCKVAGVVPDKYGYCQGNWITLLYKPGQGEQTLPAGQIGWANLDGTKSASETEAEMNGRCGTRVGDTLGTPGVQQSIADVWNFRFGIYKDKTPDYADPKRRPDYTGYSYTSVNWVSQANAYGDFKAKRLAFASCANTTTSVKTCEDITGLKVNGQSLAIPGAVDGGHRQYGRDRRVVLVPIVDDSMKVKDYGCLLMLQPLSTPPKVDVQLEYLGLANLPSGPCTSSGLPGGTAGPLAPVLVE